jgi:hypothetical protein
MVTPIFFLSASMVCAGLVLVNQRVKTPPIPESIPT